MAAWIKIVATPWAYINIHGRQLFGMSRNMDGTLSWGVNIAPYRKRGSALEEETYFSMTILVSISTYPNFPKMQRSRIVRTEQR